MKAFGLASALFACVACLSTRAAAHGSRVVPIEEAPLAEAPVKRLELPTAGARRAPTGLHVGSHVAYDVGGGSLRSVFGGVQVGFDQRLPSRVVLGAEADVSFPYFAEDGVVSRDGATATKLDFVSTARARVGYALDPALIYATGGLEWSQARRATDGAEPAIDGSLGWALGGGAEIAIRPSWSLRLEYLFHRLGSTPESEALDVHAVRLGVQWHFGEAPALTDAAGPAWIAPEDWNAHWQLTFIEQGYFGFRSPYEGANSLSSATQFRNTASATAFLGVRLWEGAEAYFNPEIDQGHGLSETLGVAGFPNGEAQKASYPVPRLNIDRLMIRQTIDLGGERVAVADGPNQLPGERDVSRVTITAGRFTVGDSFGLNAYANDPRTQFLNWNVYGGGAYDWVMDKPGFTWGASIELNQKRWAVRAGYFLQPTEANGNTFDTAIPAHGQYLLEPEVRYALFARPGRVRVLAWASRANMGSYEEALAAIGTPDLAHTRRVRETWGLVLNVEQAITRDLGLFSRASWTPGKVEVMGWTDCDESVSLGTLLAGTAWDRPNDKLGFAGVVEGLSPEARAYFAAGGLGIVIGDGRLDYHAEGVMETYYSVALSSFASLTLDHQLVVNPAYNADRGPVSIYAARLHAEL